MQWIVAGIILLVGLAGMFMLVSSGTATRRKGAAASFFTGVAEVFDPGAAMIALENEKRANMLGEKEDGDPPDPSDPTRR
ncbi:MAG: hypothetical protein P0Y56_05495 [Candidatus Andeanibacterium colombiense]|uniref:Uncharacterized protein n=1 Tax=Candidatus Andeanibacterium colombiense TaxID=3121345 RepID=A0AAJ5X8Y1_9SPHN|nr:MAG: hypothetical protein P0Y56_05495 [Sphingomonadaceae bacterium]